MNGNRECVNWPYDDGSSEEHVIQMSLFVGYTSDESIKQTKIVRLVEESQNCGILDTGCSTSLWSEVAE